MTTTTDTLLPLIFDAAKLSELLDAPVAAHYLRLKKDGATTLALSRQGMPSELPQAHLWCRLASGPGVEKVLVSYKKAVARGHRVEIAVSSDVTLVAGHISSDPKLRPITAAVNSVIRYNPLRRLIGRTPEGHAVRVTATSHARLAEVARHLAPSHPVLTPLTADDRVSVWPWMRHGDLAWSGDAGVARQAGAALARLHRAPAMPGLAAVEVWQSMRAVAREIALVAPELSARFDALVARWQGLWQAAEPAFVHGDFKADQVLIDDDGRALLTDFDRAGLGHPGLDLGSFVAAGTSIMVDELLAGYAEHADVPGEEVVRAWTVFAHLRRLTEPFRRVQPGWRAQIEARLGDVEAWS